MSNPTDLPKDSLPSTTLSQSSGLDPDTETRVAAYVKGADLESVAAALQARRDEILGRWLAAARAQPFHAARPDRAIADHIPRLFDALAAFLARVAPRSVAPPAPMDDQEIHQAARAHARQRFEQGLGVADVVTEFRLLRQEIGRALREHLVGGWSVSDLLAAELLVQDTLDGAAEIGLAAWDFQIAGRKQAEEARERALAEAERRREEAERAHASLQTFLAIVAHDLRNPLTTIKGYADLLRRQSEAGGLGSERIADYARTISTTAAKMSTQLAELLDTARLQLGEQLELERRPTDLVALASRIAGEAQATADHHTIEVEAEVPELAGTWDAARLERVLGNLIGNAVKYSPGGGTITVQVGREEQDRRHWAFLVIRDWGIGIPAADLPRIFDPYHRAANVVGRFPGEGIGLVGAKQIVEQHGGTIGVASHEGEGSTFTLRLPLD